MNSVLVMLMNGLVHNRILRITARRALRKTCPSSFVCSTARNVLRLFSTQTTYVDEWFASIIKHPSFYEVLANAEPARCYFYNIDLHGRLFLEETMPKNIATSIKDTRFLDLFLGRIQHISKKHRDFMKDHDIPVQDYPFVSPCGKELNFIRPAATPIVFHSVDKDHLIFAGSKRQLFDPAKLAVSEHTGRLYHKVTDFALRGDTANEITAEYALVRSAVAVSLSDHITAQDDRLYYQLEHCTIPIPWLPASCEPRDWAMPASHDE